MKYRILFIFLSILLCAFDVQATIINTSTGTAINGERAGDYAGENTLPLGNFTGDIFPEMMVTVRNYSTAVHAGRIYIKQATINGLPSTVNLAIETKIIIDGENYSWLGSKVRLVPDYNHNGYNEILTTAGVNFYIIEGAAVLPTTFNIADVGITVPGRKFIGTDSLRSVEFGDFDKDGELDMIFSGAGLALGEAGIIYLSKLPPGPVTINDALFDGVKAKKFTNVVGFLDHNIAVSDLDGNGQDDYIFCKDGTVQVYINNVLVNTINTMMSASMVFSAGDMQINGLKDFVVVGNIYPKGFTIGLVFNKGTWTTSSNLVLDGISGSEIKGIGTLASSDSYTIIPSPFGAIIGDTVNNRVVVINPKSTWPATYTVTTLDQTDNTKIIGGTHLGTSVGISDNMFGGIGCMTESALFIGSNNINLVGKSYVVKYKK